jgi:hypothetical protein
MTKQYYYPVDAITGEAEQTAIEALVRGGMAHIPSNALRKKPLAEKIGFAVIAKADLSGTEYISDHRGKIIYSTADATQTKTVSELGEIEAGWTLEQPLPFSVWENNQWVQQLDLLQQAKHSDVNSWRNAQEASAEKTVMVASINWNADPTSRDRILSTLQSAFIPPFWTDADNIDQPIIREQLQAVHTAIVELGFAIHARQRVMKAEIAALTSCAAVNDYMIGWPV